MAAVVVHIDLDGDRPDASSLLALAAGRHVASSWGATLYAVVIAHDPQDRVAPDATAQVKTPASLPGFEAIESALATGGADKVVFAITDTPISPLWVTVGGAWQGVLDHLRPRVVLFGADAPSAAELAPRTGARIGARLLGRARAIGIDDVELRDKDGAYMRASDSGAAVAMIARADAAPRGEADVDLLVLALPGGADPRVELAGTGPAELVQGCSAIVALGDDALEPKIIADAKKLAALLGAQLVGGAAAARAKAVPAAAVIERTTPLAPELCIAVGNAQLDVAGSASFVKIGGRGGKTVDGALSGAVETGVRDLVQRLAGGPAKRSKRGGG